MHSVDNAVEKIYHQYFICPMRPKARPKARYDHIGLQLKHYSLEKIFKPVNHPSINQTLSSFAKTLGKSKEGRALRMLI